MAVDCHSDVTVRSGKCARPGTHAPRRGNRIVDIGLWVFPLDSEFDARKSELGGALVTETLTVLAFHDLARQAPRDPSEVLGQWRRVPLRLRVDAVHNQHA